MSEQPVLTTSKGARVAVVDGIRTPFIKKIRYLKRLGQKILAQWSLMNYLAV